VRGSSADADLAQSAKAVLRARNGTIAAPSEEADPVDALERELVEAGDAQRFVRLHGSHVRYVKSWGAWIVWKDGRWTCDEGAVDVTEMAKDVGRELLAEAPDSADSAERNRLIAWAKKALSARGIRAMVELARGIEGVPVEHESLDAHPWLFNARNGVIDLHTGELLPADPAYLMTKQSPVAYVPHARAPRWERALKQWFPNPDTREYVQRLAGSALVGEQRDHIFVIHHGEGRNGKGTFVRALLMVFGPYAVTADMSLIVQRKYSEHETVKAELFRARLAVAAETERQVSLAEASVKNLTGADPIHCRRMRENPWSFTPSHSLWLQTNHLPEIGGRDRGIWSRMRVVPWNANFETAPERNLYETLATEAEGILAWLVRGCVAWQRAGLREPKQVLRSTQGYRKSQDVLARFAQREGVVFKPTLDVAVETMNDACAAWATSQGIRIVNAELSRWLRENGATQARTRKDGKQYRTWIGVGLGISPSVTTVTDPTGTSAKTPHISINKADLSHPSHRDLGEAREPDNGPHPARDDGVAGGGVGS
jgi:putative DNA primase/helicase